MKQHARTHADLDAMLIGQKTVPKGCRVMNVSPQGMMLQCEPDGRLLTFRDADLVDIHLTVQHGGGRKKFAIPAIVNRVDIKSIDVVFQHPNPELLKLIEAYRISDAHMMEASIAHSPQEAVAKVSSLPNAKTASATAEKKFTDERPGGRRVLYPVLLTIILSTCIAAGAYLYTSGIDTRLGVLETITINQTNELAEIRSRIFSSSLQEGRYASLNARLQALTDAFGTIESKLDTVISGKPVQTGSMTAKTEAAGQGYRGTETPISISSENPAVKSTTASTPDSSLPVGKPAEGSTPTVKPESALSLMAPATTQGELPKSGDTGTESATAAASPGTTGSQPANRTEPSQTKLNGIPEENPDTGNKVDKPALMAGSGAGPWVINLLSSRKKQDTDRLAGIAAGNGIPVVQNRAIVQGKEYWRLQITGFRNATEAKNYALPVKQKLGIKDVWIFRQKN